MCAPAYRHPLPIHCLILKSLVKNYTASSFRPVVKIRATASECKVPSSFQCWALPRTTEGVSPTSPKNPTVAAAFDVRVVGANVGDSSGRHFWSWRVCWENVATPLLTDWPSLTARRHWKSGQRATACMVAGTSSRRCAKTAKSVKSARCCY